MSQVVHEMKLRPKEPDSIMIPALTGNDLPNEECRFRPIEDTLNNVTFSTENAYIHPYNEERFQIFDAKGDGNCGFYAYMYYLYYIKNELHDIRNKTFTPGSLAVALLGNNIPSAPVDPDDNKRKIFFSKEDVNKFKKVIFDFITGSGDNSYLNIWEQQGADKLPQDQLAHIRTMCEKLKVIYNILSSPRDGIPQMNIYINDSDNIRFGNPIKFKDDATEAGFSKEEVQKLNIASKEAYNALEKSSFASEGASGFKPTDAMSIYIAFSQLICGVDTQHTRNATVEDRKGQFSTEIMITLYRMTYIPVFTIGCSLFKSIKGKWFAQIDNECFTMPAIQDEYDYLGYPIGIKEDTAADTPPILLANIGGGHFQCVIPSASIGIEGAKGPWVEPKSTTDTTGTKQIKTLEDRIISALNGMGITQNRQKIAQEAVKRTSTLEGALNYIFENVTELSEKDKTVTDDDWKLPDDLQINTKILEDIQDDETAAGRTSENPTEEPATELLLPPLNPNISKIFSQDISYMPPINRQTKTFYISYLDCDVKSYQPTCHKLGTLQDYADRLYNKIVTVAIEVNHTEAVKVAASASNVKKAWTKTVTAAKVVKNETLVPNYVEVALNKFKEKNTGVFDSELDEWVHIIDGAYSKEYVLGAWDQSDREGTDKERLGKEWFGMEYKNPLEENLENTEGNTKVHKIESSNFFGNETYITHLNSPNEINFYKKLNTEKSLDWLGATSAPALNFFNAAMQRIDYQGGGLTIILLKEMIPKTTNWWWDVNLQELKIAVKTQDTMPGMKSILKSLGKHKRDAYTKRFNIKPKLVSIIASNSPEFNIKGKIPDLYNLKVNGINTDFMISESELRDRYEYAYEQNSHIHPPYNNALNAEYIIRNFMEDNDRGDENLKKTKKFLFPNKFSKGETSAPIKAQQDAYADANKKIEESLEKAKSMKGQPLTVEETKKIQQEYNISSSLQRRIGREAHSLSSVASYNNKTGKENLVDFKKITNDLIGQLDTEISKTQENCDETKDAVASSLSPLSIAPPPQWKQIEKFPFPPHLYQEFNSENDSGLLYKENIMLVPKMKKVRHKGVSSKYVWEDTRCLATGKGCVDYQKDIDDTIATVKEDTPQLRIPKDIIKGRDDIIDKLVKSKEEAKADTRSSKSSWWSGTQESMAWVGIATDVVDLITSL